MWKQDIKNNLILEFDNKSKLTSTELLCYELDTELKISVSPLFNQLKRVFCKTNYPLQDKKFKRDEFDFMELFYSVESSRYENIIHLKIPGAFVIQIFYLSYDIQEERIIESILPIDAEKQEHVLVSELARFIVQPKLHLDSLSYPLTSICLLTVLSRCMGSLNLWAQQLKQAHDTHYNAIHITPMQKLGRSESNYSVADFCEYNSLFFSDDIKNNPKEQIKYLKRSLNRFRKDYKMVFFTDIILNHASPDCEIFRNQNNCYNCWNTPQLYPSLMIDQFLQKLSSNLINGVQSDSNGLLPRVIRDRNDVNRIMAIIDEYLDLHLKDYFSFNMDSLIDQFGSFLNLQEDCEPLSEDLNRQLYRYVYRCIYEENIGKPKPFSVHKYPSTIFVDFYIPIPLSRLYSILERIQSLYTERCNIILGQIKGNLYNTMIYRFLDNPKRKPLSKSYMLFDNYFSELITSTNESYYGCNNGWTMGNNRDPMNHNISNTIDIDDENFRNQYTDEYIQNHGKDLLIDNVYTRRELIVWGDCVKFRYGSPPTLNPTTPASTLPQTVVNTNKKNKKNKGKRRRAQSYAPTSTILAIDNLSDEPFIQSFEADKKTNYGDYDLYTYMTQYIQINANLFDGFRIDNAHNTDISVLSYFIDVARSVNPNLIVVSELFTNDRNRDKEYVDTIGINLLIRESIQSYKPSEMTSILYKCGGYDYGTFQDFSESDQPSSSMLPVVLYDLTHDNESYYHNFSLKQSLAMSSLLSLAFCSIASTKGFDECYIDNPSVMEKKLYSSDNILSKGITMIKGKLNSIHQLLSNYGFNYRYLHHYDNSNIVCIQRFHNTLPYTVLCITYLDYKFIHQNDSNLSFSVDGKIIGHLLSATMTYKESELKEFINPLEYTMKGIDSRFLGLKYSDQGDLNFFDYSYNDKEFITTINVRPTFVPGSFAIYLIETNSVMIHPDNESNIIDIHSKPLLNFDQSCKLIASSQKYDDSLFIPNHIKDSLIETLSTLNLYDFSYILFTANQEERLINEQGPYCLYKENDQYCYGTGEFPYAGIMSVIAIIDYIYKHNDISHPLLNNMRNGHWLVDYHLNRIRKYPGLFELLKNEFELIYNLPRGIRPLYICKLFYLLYQSIQEVICTQMKIESQSVSTFYTQLSVDSIQFLQQLPSMFDCLPAAGFPHFQTEWLRVWGRDTFISFKGLYLDTKRYENGRDALLTFARSLYNGLIPNLFDTLVNPRYNSRDSVWWYLDSLHQYCVITGDYGILEERIKRIYQDTIYTRESSLIQEFNNKYIENPEDNVNEEKGERLIDLIHNIFIYHLNGIHFRERNSDKIDENMQDQGFNIDIHTDLTTGLILGGNIYNCGTWMDKMGSSIAPNNSNKGIPATSRDGAPIEITCLVASCLNWIVESIQNHHYCYTDLPILNEGRIEKTISYSDWFGLIQNNFHKLYYIPTVEEEIENPNQFVIHKDYVFNRGIYKDVYGSTYIYPDYQYRCNQVIGISIAPFLFPSTTCTVLQKIINDLYGPEQLGMKTLSENDMAYRPRYINQDYIGDSSVNCGQNYHNGPEWVWPIGHLLHSISLFPPFIKKTNTYSIHDLLIQYLDGLTESQRYYIKSNIWYSLPELTQRNGEYCVDSCQSQCWSISTILDAYYSIYMNSTE